MQTSEHLMPELLAVLCLREWKGQRRGRRQDTVLPPLKAVELHALRAGLGAAIYDAQLFDRLFEFYMTFPCLPIDPNIDLPFELKDRVLSKGMGAISPREVIQLATMPVWVAALRDAIVDCQSSASKLVDRCIHHQNPYWEFARAELDRVAKGIGHDACPSNRALADAVLTRAFGSPQAGGRSLMLFLVAVSETIRERLLDIAASTLMTSESSLRCRGLTIRDACVLSMAGAQQAPEEFLALDAELRLLELPPLEMHVWTLTAFLGRTDREVAELTRLPAHEVADLRLALEKDFGAITNGLPVLETASARRKEPDIAQPMISVHSSVPRNAPRPPRGGNLRFTPDANNPRQFRGMFHLSCWDRPGILHDVSSWLSYHRANIDASCGTRLGNGLHNAVYHFTVPASEHHLSEMLGDVEISRHSEMVPTAGLKDILLYDLRIEARDREGIFREVSSHLVNHGMNVQSLANKTFDRPEGAITNIVLKVEVPQEKVGELGLIVDDIRRADSRGVWRVHYGRAGKDDLAFANPRAMFGKN